MMTLLRGDPYLTDDYGPKPSKEDIQIETLLEIEKVPEYDKPFSSFSFQLFLQV